MAKPRLKELVPSDDKPLARQVQRFITFYVHAGRDLKEAACKADLDPAWGEKLWNQPKVRAAIERQLTRIEKEQAKQTAKAALLGVELVDETLVSQLKRRSERVPADVLKLGYGRLGMMRDNEFLGVPKTAGAPSPAKTYGQIHTTTLRRTTTEELVQSSETAVQVRGELQAPAPPVPMAPTMQIQLLQPDVEDYPG